jgi:hypothetical protein
MGFYYVCPHYLLLYCPLSQLKFDFIERFGPTQHIPSVFPFNWFFYPSDHPFIPFLYCQWISPAVCLCRFRVRTHCKRVSGEAGAWRVWYFNQEHIFTQASTYRVSAAGWISSCYWLKSHTPKAPATPPTSKQHAFSASVPLERGLQLQSLCQFSDRANRASTDTEYDYLLRLSVSVFSVSCHTPVHWIRGSVCKSTSALMFSP